MRDVNFRDEVRKRELQLMDPQPPGLVLWRKPMPRAEIEKENGELEGVAEEERNRGDQGEASQREEPLPEGRNFGAFGRRRGAPSHAALSGPRAR